MAELNNDTILLVHPLGYKASAAAADISRLANIMPPLGLASIAAWLEQKRGLKAEIIDCYADPSNADRLIVERLHTLRPGYIGFSCTTSSFLDGVRLAALAKSELPGIRAVFGGAHVSALKEQVLERFPAVDYVVVGEGEETLAELMLAKGAAVPGLVLRAADGTVRFTGHRAGALELDSLPFPAYEKLAGYPQAYQLPLFNYPKAPNTSCISSRGCPYACSYCDRSVFRRTFRWNSAGYLYAHLKYLRERFGIRHINFYDDQFTFQRKRVEEFCRLMIEQPLGMTFNCAVRAEHVDLELLQLMKAAGCWMVSLGIETGDPELLAKHRQNPDLDMLADKIRLIKRAGIRTKGLLMMGLPGESEESIKRSMEYVFSLPIDDFNLAKFTPFPGTPIYENVHEQGTFDEDWAKMDCMHFQFVPHGMTRERLEELFTLFYKSHFQRPRVLLGYVAMLWKSPDSWRRFAGNLGSFLRFARSSQRIDGEG
ncbi:MAG: B12-binding domain-containing radical SAM protein [Desulfuromonadales bacterium GWD2_61_12]|nr:MAG: B12-binding domain-containing radical SAM protein [Desulfuromonadales bacterium GWD2_61_12]HBT82653.1 B12-binding domain-containing radical SAM protein [Desulfuromonas sp.]